MGGHEGKKSLTKKYQKNNQRGPLLAPAQGFNVSKEADEGKKVCIFGTPGNPKNKETAIGE